MAAKGGSSKRAADLQRSMTDNTPSKLSTKVARLTNTPKSSLRTQNQQKTGPDMDKITQEIDMATLFKMMESMQVQLSKLEKLDLIEQKISRMEQDVSDFKTSLNFFSSEIEDIKANSQQANDKIARAETELEKLKVDNVEMKKNIIDLKSRSMRDNSVFYNIQEKEEENATDEIFQFLEKELQIEKPKEKIKIDRAHRMGRKMANKTRPIVAKFNYHQDKEGIRKQAYLLKGKRFGISEQFPKEITEERKRLLPLYKQAKQEGKRAVLKYDKLIVEGRIVK